MTESEEKTNKLMCDWLTEIKKRSDAYYCSNPCDLSPKGNQDLMNDHNQAKADCRYLLEKLEELLKYIDRLKLAVAEKDALIFELQEMEDKLMAEIIEKNEKIVNLVRNK